MPLSIAVLSLVMSLGPAATDAPVVSVLRVPDAGVQPQVAAAPDGTLHLLYYKGDPASGDLFYAARPAGAAGFSEPIRVNSQPGSAVAMGNIRGGQLALGRDGRVHAAWNGSPSATPKGPKNPELPADSPHSGTPMLYARLDASRSAFEPQRNLMTRSTSLDGGGSVAADRAGHVYVVWHGSPLESVGGGEPARRVFVARSGDDGATFAPEVPVSSAELGACPCCGLRAHAAPDGSLSILFRAAAGGVHRDATLLRSTGGTFTTTTLDPWRLDACPMSSAAIADAPGSALALAWETRGNVFLQLRGPAGDVRPAIAPPGEASSRKYPAVAVNSRGQVLMAWTEGMIWGKGGSVHWQLFSADGRALPQGAGSADGVPAWSLVAAAANSDGSFVVLY
jgi:hypothetical protein